MSNRKTLTDLTPKQIEAAATQALSQGLAEALGLHKDDRLVVKISKMEFDLASEGQDLEITLKVTRKVVPSVGFTG